MRRSGNHPNLIRLEIACGFSWFLSDGTWLLEWRWACYAAGALALLTGLAIFAYQERRLVPMLVCCADTSWLLFNTLWSFGDLGGFPALVTAAKGLFVLGFLLYAAALSLHDGRRSMLDLVLRRLRFMRSISGE